MFVILSVLFTSEIPNTLLGYGTNPAVSWGPTLAWAHVEMEQQQTLAPED